MSYSEPVPEVIPKTIEARARFVKARYLEYKAELIGRSGVKMPEERVRPIANELAVGDLLALLGRLGERAWRIQFDFEELHEGECERHETAPSELVRAA
jgi:hypothetical protein